MTNHHIPQLDLLANDQTISAIAKELDLLKLKLQYAAQNSESIEDRQEISDYLNELVRDLTSINSDLPPLPQEMEIFDNEHQ